MFDLCRFGPGYKCKFCGKMYASSTQRPMKNHIKRDHLGQQTLMGGPASMSMPTVTPMTSTTPEGTGAVSLSYPCNKCQVHFFTYEDLMVHSWRVHNTVPINQNVPPVPRQVVDLVQPEKKSGKLKYACQLCEESYNIIEVRYRIN